MDFIRSKKQTILFLASVITVIIILLTFVVKQTYGVTDKTFTRDEMQDMVVSTALSYYYNNLYSDYSQRSKDTSFGFNNTLVGSTYLWRSTKHTPEMVSRTNKYFIDCSSFAYIVYKNGLGYDFSDHYQNARYSYFKLGKKYGYYNMSNSNISRYSDVFYTEKQTQELFQEMVSQTGMEPDGYYYANISSKIAKNDNTHTSDDTGAYMNDSSSNKTQAVYYFEATGSTVEEVREEIEGKSEVMLDELRSVLKPGDILTYAFRDKNSDGSVSGNSGHVMIYVGDAIRDGERGMIHSTGYDYTYNEDGTMASPGNDTYSVRYDDFDKRLPNYILKETDTQIIYKVSVERPINQFCNNNICEIPTGTDTFSKSVDTELIDNAVARNDLSRLRIEQYAEIDKEYNDKNLINSMSKYNSVNVGDEITYYLRLQNKANFSYCDRSLYYTKSGCENAGYNWLYSEKENEYKYENLKITSKIPDNTTYVEGSCTNKCSYNEDTRTITWTTGEIEPNSAQTTNIYSAQNPTYIYSYKVIPTKEGTVTNEGMKITSENDTTLTLASMDTMVNPTLNGINIDIFKQEIEKFQQKFNEGKIKYNASIITSNYKQDLDTLDSTITLAEGEFIKMLYYNTMGIDIGYLNVNVTGTGDMITALFNKREMTAGSETREIYYTKTNEDYEKLTGSQKIISEMLVPGLYGGRQLHGNDNKDRESILRVRNNNFSAGSGMNDLEFGDIIFYMSDNLNKITTFMYYGQDEDGYPIFVKFTSDGLVFYDRESSGGKTGFEKFVNIYSRELFWVLRPTKAYGTTINYNYNGGLGSDESYVAYNTYKNLVTPTKENYNVTLEYNENVSSTYPKTLSSTNTFNGWYTDNDVRVTNNTSLATEEAHTLNAKYTTSSVALPTPEKEGYYFEGWYKDSSFSNKITNKIYIPSKDETLYAKFIELPEVEINLKLEEENKINLEVEKQKGNLSGYEIYLYNNENNTYEKIRDESNLETTIDYEFKDFENVKIYIRPFITIENKRVYGNISSIKEIGPEIKVGTLEITKIDKETKEKLEGTEIEIYDEQTNERVFKGTTNKNGILKVNDLIIGKNYYLKETVPSKGYKLNNEEIKIKLEKENEEKKIQIENEIIKGNIKITVVEEYTKEPIENVSVLINDESKSTNVLGEIILDDVRYGNYVISLEEVPDGYLLNDKKENIMIEEETTEEITITLEKEKIPVPITDSDKNNLLEKIIGLVLIIIGIVSIVFYVRKKNA